MVVNPELEPGEIEVVTHRDPWSAAGKGDADTVLTWLKEFPTDVDELDSVNRSILVQACFSGNTSLVRDLLALGANVNVVTDGNFPTPLSAAITVQDIPLVSLLLEHGANPCIPNFRGDTAFHHAVMHPTFLEILLARHPNVEMVNQKNCFNETPMDVAVEMGIIRSYELLVWYLDRK